MHLKVTRKSNNSTGLPARNYSKDKNLPEEKYYLNKSQPSRQKEHILNKAEDQASKINYNKRDFDWLYHANFKDFLQAIRECDFVSSTGTKHKGSHIWQFSHKEFSNLRLNLQPDKENHSKKYQVKQFQKNLALIQEWRKKQKESDKQKNLNNELNIRTKNQSRFFKTENKKLYVKPDTALIKKPEAINLSLKAKDTDFIDKKDLQSETFVASTFSTLDKSNKDENYKPENIISNPELENFKIPSSEAASAENAIYDIEIEQQEDEIYIELKEYISELPNNLIYDEYINITINIILVLFDLDIDGKLDNKYLSILDELSIKFPRAGFIISKVYKYCNIEDEINKSVEVLLRACKDGDYWALKPLSEYTTFINEYGFPEVKAEYKNFINELYNLFNSKKEKANYSAVKALAIYKGLIGYSQDSVDGVKRMINALENTDIDSYLKIIIFNELGEYYLKSANINSKPSVDVPQLPANEEVLTGKNIDEILKNSLESASREYFKKVPLKEEKEVYAELRIAETDLLKLIKISNQSKKANDPTKVRQDLLLKKAIDCNELLQQKLKELPAESFHQKFMDPKNNTFDRIRYGLACQYYMLRGYENAIAHFEDLAKENNISAKFNLALLLIYKASVYKKTEYLEEAIKHLQNSISHLQCFELYKIFVNNISEEKSEIKDKFSWLSQDKIQSIKSDFNIAMKKKAIEDGNFEEIRKFSEEFKKINQVSADKFFNLLYKLWHKKKLFNQGKENFAEDEKKSHLAEIVKLSLEIKKYKTTFFDFDPNLIENFFNNLHAKANAGDNDAKNFIERYGIDVEHEKK